MATVYGCERVSDRRRADRKPLDNGRGSPAHAVLLITMVNSCSWPVSCDQLALTLSLSVM